VADQAAARALNAAVERQLAPYGVKETFGLGRTSHVNVDSFSQNI